MAYVHCPLCESTRGRVIARFAGAYNFRARTVVCKDCGFLFRSRPWSEEQVAELQRRLSHWADACGDEFARKREVGLRHEQSARRRLRWIRGYVPPPARVLGVGAGGNVFAEAARVVGFDATGIEPGPPPVQDTERRGGPDGLTPLNRAQLRAESFDVVALFSVLEQVPDLHEALTAVRQLLKSGGHLIVEVRDPMHMTGRPKDHLAPEHNWHFTDRTLGLLLEKEGLPPVDVIRRDTGEEHVLFAAGRKDRVPDPATICLRNPLEFQRVQAHFQEARWNAGLTPGALVRDAVTMALGPWLGMRTLTALRSFRNGVTGRTGRLYRTALG